MPPVPSSKSTATAMAEEAEAFEEFVKTIRRFVREQLDPLAATVESTKAVPESAIAAMRELGLFGLTVPPEYGGQGLSTSQFCRIAFELGRTHQAFRALININNGIGSHSLVAHGSERQKTTLLPSIADGSTIVAFALSEPGAGSDVRAIATKAAPVDGGWSLNGVKQWITNGPVANIFVVIARDEQKGPEAYTAFIVKGSPEGLTRGKPDEKMGFTGSLTSQLVFDNVVLPEDAVIGERGNGFEIALSSVNAGRLAVSAGAIGAAKEALRLSIAHARSREAFGGPIAQKQAIQHMLADMAVDVELAETLLLRVAKLADAGAATADKVAMVKLFASEAACRVADSAVQIHGAMGYVKPFSVERIYRDVRLFRIVEGTSEIQRNVIAKSLLRNYTDTEDH